VRSIVRVDGFPFVHRERVRFRDCDAMGHVNNAVYSTYLEQARIAFLQPKGAAVANMILARAEIDFRAPMSVADEVHIEVRPVRVGTKSFELEYTLRVRDTVVAEAKTVLVAYDYTSEQSVEVPDAWREALAA
jgi:acyl-CoA thioester hydrolase